MNSLVEVDGVLMSANGLTLLQELNLERLCTGEPDPFYDTAAQLVGTTDWSRRREVKQLLTWYADNLPEDNLAEPIEVYESKVAAVTDIVRRTIGLVLTRDEVVETKPAMPAHHDTAAASLRHTSRRTTRRTAFALANA